MGLSVQGLGELRVFWDSLGWDVSLAPFSCSVW